MLNYLRKMLLKHYNLDLLELSEAIGSAEVVHGDYMKYKQSIEILKNLTNDDIKRLVTQYLKRESTIMVSVNHNERGWFNFIPNLVINWVVLPLTNPWD